MASGAEIVEPLSKAEYSSGIVDKLVNELPLEESKRIDVELEQHQPIHMMMGKPESEDFGFKTQETMQDAYQGSGRAKEGESFSESPLSAIVGIKVNETGNQMPMPEKDGLAEDEGEKFAGQGNEKDCIEDVMETEFLGKNKKGNPEVVEEGKTDDEETSMEERSLIVGKEVSSMGKTLEDIMPDPSQEHSQYASGATLVHLPDDIQTKTILDSKEMKDGIEFPRKPTVLSPTSALEVDTLLELQSPDSIVPVNESNVRELGKEANDSIFNRSDALDFHVVDNSEEDSTEPSKSNIRKPEVCIPVADEELLDAETIFTNEVMPTSGQVDEAKSPLPMETDVGDECDASKSREVEAKIHVSVQEDHEVIKAAVDGSRFKEQVIAEKEALLQKETQVDEDSEHGEKADDVIAERASDEKQDVLPTEEAERVNNEGTNNEAEQVGEILSTECEESIVEKIDEATLPKEIQSAVVTEVVESRDISISENRSAEKEKDTLIQEAGQSNDVVDEAETGKMNETSGFNTEEILHEVKETQAKDKSETREITEIATADFSSVDELQSQTIKEEKSGVLDVTTVKKQEEILESRPEEAENEVPVLQVIKEAEEESEIQKDSEAVAVEHSSGIKEREAGFGCDADITSEERIIEETNESKEPDVVAGECNISKGPSQEHHQPSLVDVSAKPAEETSAVESECGLPDTESMPHSVESETKEEAKVDERPKDDASLEEINMKKEEDATSDSGAVTVPDMEETIVEKTVHHLSDEPLVAGKVENIEEIHDKSSTNVLEDPVKVPLEEPEVHEAQEDDTIGKKEDLSTKEDSIQMVAAGNIESESELAELSEDVSLRAETQPEELNNNSEDSVTGGDGLKESDDKYSHEGLLSNKPEYAKADDEASSNSASLPKSLESGKVVVEEISASKNPERISEDDYKPEDVEADLKQEVGILDEVTDLEDAGKDKSHAEVPSEDIGHGAPREISEDTFEELEKTHIADDANIVKDKEIAFEEASGIEIKEKMETMPEEKERHENADDTSGATESTEEKHADTEKTNEDETEAKLQHGVNLESSLAAEVSDERCIEEKDEQTNGAPELKFEAREILEETRQAEDEENIHSRECTIETENRATAPELMSGAEASEVSTEIGNSDKHAAPEEVITNLEPDELRKETIGVDDSADRKASEEVHDEGKTDKSKALNEALDQSIQNDKEVISDEAPDNSESVSASLETDKSISEESLIPKNPDEELVEDKKAELLTDGSKPAPDIIHEVEDRNYEALVEIEEDTIHKPDESTIADEANKIAVTVKDTSLAEVPSEDIGYGAPREISKDKFEELEKSHIVDDANIVMDKEFASEEVSGIEITEKMETTPEEKERHGKADETLGVAESTEEKNADPEKTNEDEKEVKLQHDVTRETEGVSGAEASVFFTEIVNSDENAAPEEVVTALEAANLRKDIEVEEVHDKGQTDELKALNEALDDGIQIDKEVISDEALDNSKSVSASLEADKSISQESLVPKNPDGELMEDKNPELLTVDSKPVPDIIKEVDDPAVAGKTASVAEPACEDQSYEVLAETEKDTSHKTDQTTIADEVNKIADIGKDTSHDEIPSKDIGHGAPQEIPDDTFEELEQTHIVDDANIVMEKEFASEEVSGIEIKEEVETMPEEKEWHGNADETAGVTESTEEKNADNEKPNEDETEGKLQHDVKLESSSAAEVSEKKCIEEKDERMNRELELNVEARESLEETATAPEIVSGVEASEISAEIGNSEKHAAPEEVITSLEPENLLKETMGVDDSTGEKPSEEVHDEGTDELKALNESSNHSIQNDKEVISDEAPDNSESVAASLETDKSISEESLIPKKPDGELVEDKKPELLMVDSNIIQEVDDPTVTGKTASVVEPACEDQSYEALVETEDDTIHKPDQSTIADEANKIADNSKDSVTDEKTVLEEISASKNSEGLPEDDYKPKDVEFDSKQEFGIVDEVSNSEDAGNSTSEAELLSDAMGHGVPRETPEGAFQELEKAHVADDANIIMDKEFTSKEVTCIETKEKMESKPEEEEQHGNEDETSDVIELTEEKQDDTGKTVEDENEVKPQCDVNLESSLVSELSEEKCIEEKDEQMKETPELKAEARESLEETTQVEEANIQGHEDTMQSESCVTVQEVLSGAEASEISAEIGNADEKVAPEEVITTSETEKPCEETIGVDDSSGRKVSEEAHDAESVMINDQGNTDESKALDETSDQGVERDKEVICDKELDNSESVSASLETDKSVSEESMIPKNHDDEELVEDKKLENIVVDSKLVHEEVDEPADTGKTISSDETTCEYQTHEALTRTEEDTLHKPDQGTVADEANKITDQESAAVETSKKTTQSESEMYETVDDAAGGNEINEEKHDETGKSGEAEEEVKLTSDDKPDISLDAEVREVKLLEAEDLQPNSQPEVEASESLKETLQVEDEPNIISQETIKPEETETVDLMQQSKSPEISSIAEVTKEANLETEELSVQGDAKDDEGKQDTPNAVDREEVSIGEDSGLEPPKDEINTVHVNSSLGEEKAETPDPAYQSLENAAMTREMKEDIQLEEKLSGSKDSETKGMNVEELTVETDSQQVDIIDKKHDGDEEVGDVDGSKRTKHMLEEDSVPEGDCTTVLAEDNEAAVLGDINAKKEDTTTSDEVAEKETTTTEVSIPNETKQIVSDEPLTEGSDESDELILYKPTTGGRSEAPVAEPREAPQLHDALEDDRSECTEALSGASNKTSTVVAGNIAVESEQAEDSEYISVRAETQSEELVDNSEDSATGLSNEHMDTTHDKTRELEELDSKSSHQVVSHQENIESEETVLEEIPASQNPEGQLEDDQKLEGIAVDSKPEAITVEEVINPADSESVAGSAELPSEDIGHDVPRETTESRVVDDANITMDKECIPVEARDVETKENIESASKENARNGTIDNTSGVDDLTGQKHDDTRKISDDEKEEQPQSNANLGSSSAAEVSTEKSLGEEEVQNNKAPELKVEGNESVMEMTQVEEDANIRSNEESVKPDICATTREVVLEDEPSAEFGNADKLVASEEVTSPLDSKKQPEKKADDYAFGEVDEEVHEAAETMRNDEGKTREIIPSDETSDQGIVVDKDVASNEALDKSESISGPELEKCVSEESKISNIADGETVEDGKPEHLVAESKSVDDILDEVDSPADAVKTVGDAKPASEDQSQESLSGIEEETLHKPDEIATTDVSNEITNPEYTTEIIKTEENPMPELLKSSHEEKQNDIGKANEAEDEQHDGAAKTEVDASESPRETLQVANEANIQTHEETIKPDSQEKDSEVIAQVISEVEASGSSAHVDGINQAVSEEVNASSEPEKQCEETTEADYPIEDKVSCEEDKADGPKESDENSSNREVQPDEAHVETVMSLPGSLGSEKTVLEEISTSEKPETQPEKDHKPEDLVVDSQPEEITVEEVNNPANSGTVTDSAEQPSEDRSDEPPQETTEDSFQKLEESPVVDDANIIIDTETKENIESASEENKQYENVDTIADLTDLTSETEQKHDGFQTISEDEKGVQLQPDVDLGSSLAAEASTEENLEEEDSQTNRTPELKVEVNESLTETAQIEEDANIHSNEETVKPEICATTREVFSEAEPHEISTQTGNADEKVASEEATPAMEPEKPSEKIVDEYASGEISEEVHDAEDTMRTDQGKTDEIKTFDEISDRGIDLAKEAVCDEALDSSESVSGSETEKHVSEGSGSTISNTAAGEPVEDDRAELLVVDSKPADDIKVEVDNPADAGKTSSDVNTEPMLREEKCSEAEDKQRTIAPEPEVDTSEHLQDISTSEKPETQPNKDHKPEDLVVDSKLEATTVEEVTNPSDSGNSTDHAEQPSEDRSHESPRETTEESFQKLEKSQVVDDANITIDTETKENIESASEENTLHENVDKTSVVTELIAEEKHGDTQKISEDEKEVQLQRDVDLGSSLAAQASKEKYLGEEDGQKSRTPELEAEVNESLTETAEVEEDANIHSNEETVKPEICATTREVMSEAEPFEISTESGNADEQVASDKPSEKIVDEYASGKISEEIHNAEDKMKNYQGKTDEIKTSDETSDRGIDVDKEVICDEALDNSESVSGSETEKHVLEGSTISNTTAGELEDDKLEQLVVDSKPADDIIDKVDNPADAGKTSTDVNREPSLAAELREVKCSEPEDNRVPEPEVNANEHLQETLPVEDEPNIQSYEETIKPDTQEEDSEITAQVLSEVEASERFAAPADAVDQAVSEEVNATSETEKQHDKTTEADYLTEDKVSCEEGKPDEPKESDENSTDRNVQIDKVLDEASTSLPVIPDTDKTILDESSSSKIELEEGNKVENEPLYSKPGVEVVDEATDQVDAGEKISHESELATEDQGNEAQSGAEEDTTEKPNESSITDDADKNIDQEYMSSEIVEVKEKMESVHEVEEQETADGSTDAIKLTEQDESVEKAEDEKDVKVQSDVTEVTDEKCLGEEDTDMERMLASEVEVSERLEESPIQNEATVFADKASTEPEIQGKDSEADPVVLSDAESRELELEDKNKLATSEEVVSDEKHPEEMSGANVSADNEVSSKEVDDEEEKVYKTESLKGEVTPEEKGVGAEEITTETAECETVAEDSAKAEVQETGIVSLLETERMAEDASSNFLLPQHSEVDLVKGKSEEEAAFEVPHDEHEETKAGFDENPGSKQHGDEPVDTLEGTVKVEEKSEPIEVTKEDKETSRGIKEVLDTEQYTGSVPEVLASEASRELDQEALTPSIVDVAEKETAATVEDIKEENEKVVGTQQDKNQELSSESEQTREAWLEKEPTILGDIEGNKDRQDPSKEVEGEEAAKSEDSTAVTVQEDSKKEYADSPLSEDSTETNCPDNISLEKAEITQEKQEDVPMEEKLMPENSESRNLDPEEFTVEADKQQENIIDEGKHTAVLAEEDQVVQEEQLKQALEDTEDSEENDKLKFVSMEQARDVVEDADTKNVTEVVVKVNDSLEASSAVVEEKEESIDQQTEDSAAAKESAKDIPRGENKDHGSSVEALWPENPEIESKTECAESPSAEEKSRETSSSRDICLENVEMTQAETSENQTEENILQPVVYERRNLLDDAKIVETREEILEAGAIASMGELLTRDKQDITTEHDEQKVVSTQHEETEAEDDKEENVTADIIMQETECLQLSSAAKVTEEVCEGGVANREILSGNLMAREEKELTLLSAEEIATKDLSDQVLAGNLETETHSADKSGLVVTKSLEISNPVEEMKEVEDVVDKEIPEKAYDSFEKIGPAETEISQLKTQLDEKPGELSTISLERETQEAAKTETEHGAHKIEEETKTPQPVTEPVFVFSDPVEPIVAVEETSVESILVSGSELEKKAVSEEVISLDSSSAREAVCIQDAKEVSSTYSGEPVLAAEVHETVGKLESAEIREKHYEVTVGNSVTDGQNTEKITKAGESLLDVDSREKKHEPSEPQLVAEGTTEEIRPELQNQKERSFDEVRAENETDLVFVEKHETMKGSQHEEEAKTIGEAFADPGVENEKGETKSGIFSSTEAIAMKEEEKTSEEEEARALRLFGSSSQEHVEESMPALDTVVLSTSRGGVFGKPEESLMKSDPLPEHGEKSISTSSGKEGDEPGSNLLKDAATEKLQVAITPHYPEEHKDTEGSSLAMPAEEAKTDDEHDEVERHSPEHDADLPVMVESSRDMDTGKTHHHKKSHNILSGVGSKVKHSISKVKKAITGGKSKAQSPKQGS